MGGEGKIVEADETYFGPVENPPTTTVEGRKPLRKNSGSRQKRAIVTLVERGGKVRSFHVPRADKKDGPEDRGR